MTRSCRGWLFDNLKVVVLNRRNRIELVVSDCAMPTWLRVTTVIAIALARSAAAQPTPRIQTEGGTAEAEEPALGAWISPPPSLAIPDYDEATAGARRVALDHDVTLARDPIHLAGALFARASQFAAQVRHERLLEVTAMVRGDKSKDPAVRTSLAAEAARHTASRTQATERAIADLLALMCDPAERSRGPGCKLSRAVRTWPQLDEALFTLAWLLESARREPEAARVYQRLVDDLPQSRLAADAAVFAGEEAFAQADLARAEKLYTQGLTSRTEGGRAYARYMLGWVQYDLGRTDEAFASFAAVATTPTTDGRLTALTRAARNDLVRAYTLPVASAHATFEQLAPGQGLDLLVRLGDLRFEAGKHADVTPIFTEAMRVAPFDPRQCAWQASITRSAAASLGPRRTATEVSNLHAALARLRKLRKVPTAQLATCIDETRKLTTELVFQLEREARTTHDARSLDLVDSLYAAMIASFPDDAGPASVRGLRVEAAWQRAELERDEPRKLWLLVVTRCDEALQVKLEEPARMKDLVTTRDLAKQRAAAAKPRP